MKHAVISLFLILLIGCQDTKYVTQYEYKEITNQPPADYLTECEQPFDSEPLSYGESVVRDEVWLTYFRLCACKIESNRQFYGYNNQGSACSKLSSPQ